MTTKATEMLSTWIKVVVERGPNDWTRRFLGIDAGHQTKRHTIVTPASTSSAR